MYGLFEPFPPGDILSGGKTDQKNPRHEPWSVCENLLMSENTSWLNISPNDGDDAEQPTQGIPYIFPMFYTRAD